MYQLFDFLALILFFCCFCSTALAFALGCKWWPYSYLLLMVGMLMLKMKIKKRLLNWHGIMAMLDVLIVLKDVKRHWILCQN